MPGPESFPIKLDAQPANIYTSKDSIKKAKQQATELEFRIYEASPSSKLILII